jgi:PAS domain-containing protein
MRSWSCPTPCATVGRRTRGASILGLAPPPTRRDQLAEFLRHHREHTSPESLGLPELREIVEGLEPNPAYLIGPRTDVLVWNAAARLMLGEPSRAPDGVQNLLWWMFTDPSRRGPSWEDTARNTLARFRAAHARRYGDPAFRGLIEALLAASPAFAELWPRHEVLTPSSAPKSSTTRSWGGWRSTTCSRSRRAIPPCA